MGVYMPPEQPDPDRPFEEAYNSPSPARYLYPEEFKQRRAKERRRSPSYKADRRSSSSRSRSRSEESGQRKPKEDVPNRLTAKRLRREQAKKDASEWAANATAESTTLLGRWRSPSPVQRDSPVYALDEEVGT